MRWMVGLVVGMAWTGVAGPTWAADERDVVVCDATVVQALQLLGLKRTDWPRIGLAQQGQFEDGRKQLDRFAAFRVREDGVIYVNPRHPFYREAKAGGTNLYPVIRLASVIRHEMQHAQADHGEADALAAQATFLEQSMILVRPERRSNAMAYLQAIRKTIPAAREWDRTGTYPEVPR